MKKSDLTILLMQKFPFFKKKQLEEVVEIILSKISDGLKKGDRTEIRGFGSFTTRTRKVQLTFPDQENKSDIKLVDKKTIYFRMGKEYFDALNIDDV